MNKRRRKYIPEGELIPLNCDFMFCDVFNNPDNIIILENFLSLYLEIPLNKIKGHLKIKSRNLKLESKKAANKQVDLILDYDDNIINIEMNTTFNSGIKDRNVVYICNIHGGQMEYGDNNYNNIHSTLQINFANLKGNNIIESYYLTDKNTGKILSEKLKIDVIYLQNDGKMCYSKREKELLKWCKLLNSDKSTKFDEVLEVLSMENEAKELLKDEVERLSDNDERFVLYSKYTREELERNTFRDATIKDIREELQEEVRKEVQEEVRKEVEKETEAIVKRMKDKNLRIEEISDITNLSIKEVKDILNNK